MWEGKNGLQRALGVSVPMILLLVPALPVGQLKLHDVPLPLHLMINVRPGVDRNVNASTASLGSGGRVEGGRDEVGARRRAEERLGERKGRGKESEDSEAVPLGWVQRGCQF